MGSLFVRFFVYGKIEIMSIKIKKINLEKNTELVFNLDNKAFTRNFDFIFKNLEEMLDFFKDSTPYIVYKNDIPVAYFAIEKRGKGEAEIMTVAVIPNYQRKGIGRMVVKKAFSLLRDYKLIKIVTHPYNIGAIILYLKSGFKIYGWKGNYFGDGQPRLLLKKGGDKLEQQKTL